MLPADWLRPFEGRVRAEVPLHRLTTWRIGGPAELLLEPESVDELVAMVRSLWRSGVPYRVLGGGSNLLVSDRGVAGAVLSLARLRRVGVHGNCIEAEAGANLHWLVRCAVRARLKGAEVLAGIPGRVGGAIFGNAGTRHGEIGRFVRVLDLLTPDGTLQRIKPGKRFFAYRRSEVGSRIVVRALLDLEPAGEFDVGRRAREIRVEREGSQPGWVGNAGCVFKNPTGSSAGLLIDSAACKGMCEGPVHVSRIHANFFENDGGGTSEAVMRLVDRVRDRVRRVHGAELELEVRERS